MVSVEGFREQFARLKGVEEGKDRLIEVSCRNNYPPIFINQINKLIELDYTSPRFGS